MKECEFVGRIVRHLPTHAMQHNRRILERRQEAAVGVQDHWLQLTDHYVHLRTLQLRNLYFLQSLSVFFHYDISYVAKHSLAVCIGCPMTLSVGVCSSDSMVPSCGL